MLQLLPFSLAELSSAGRMPTSLDAAMFRGGFPPLHMRDVRPQVWLASYMATYIERDLRQMLAVRDLSTFTRFVRLCAGRSGQLFNQSQVASDCGITHNTAKAWMSVLEVSHLVYLLRPNTRNFSKRLIKTPKLYFLDTGLAAYLLGIEDEQHMSIHPQRGALFETMVVSELLKQRYHRGLASNLTFWRDRHGHEVDLILTRRGQGTALEIKSGQTINRDFFRGLDYWADLSPDNQERVLLYGGETAAERAGVQILPWRRLGGQLFDA